MLVCCRSQQKKGNAVDILKQKPQPCIKHGKQVKFICKTCPHQCLLCEQCIIYHRNHQWITLASYLTDEVMKIFESGESKSGKAVQKFVQQMEQRLVQYQQRIQQKLKFVLGNIMKGLQKLKIKFPIKGGFQLSGSSINSKNIFQIDRILKYERYLFDTNRIQKSFNEIMYASEMNIMQNLQKMQQSISDKQWDVLEQTEIAKIQTNFLGQYKKKPQIRKFLFSVNEKNSGIKLINNRLTAIYNREIPRSPVVLFDKGFRQELHSVGFKITKMETHAHFFDMSRVYIGVCNCEVAENFGYLDLAKPSKGAYLISSNGRCFHSKLPQYHDKNLGFSFRGGDIVTIDLNIQNGQITFQKKSGTLPFWKKLSMPLALQPKFITELRGCVMFENEPGAEITILNETELQLQIDGKEVYPYIQF